VWRRMENEYMWETEREKRLLKKERNGQIFRLLSILFYLLLHGRGEWLSTATSSLSAAKTQEATWQWVVAAEAAVQTSDSVCWALHRVHVFTSKCLPPFCVYWTVVRGYIVVSCAADGSVWCDELKETFEVQYRT